MAVKRPICDYSGTRQQLQAGDTLYAALTQGSIPYIGSGGDLNEDNANLFWDSADKRLGLGNVAPGYQLEMQPPAGDLIGLYVNRIANAPSGTSGNIYGAYSGFTPGPTANTSANYAAFGFAATFPGTHNYTGTQNGALANVTISGTGTFAQVSCFATVHQQNAGAGAVTLGQTYYSNLAYAGSATTVVAYDSRWQLNNAAASVGTFYSFRAQAPAAITSGGAVTTAGGMQVNNQGLAGVTNAVGIAIAAQSGATNNVGLLLGTTAAPSGTWQVYLSAATTNYLNGRSLFGTTTDNSTDQVQVSGSTALNVTANAANLQILEATELTTIAAAATTDTTLSIPANVVVLAVSVRVTVAIPTATTFTVTGTTSGTAFNTAAVSTAANSTDPGTKAGTFFNSASQHVRFTPSSTPGTNAGRVRVTVHYYISTPPTS